MSSIRPFRALRPEPAKAALVSAVPYDVVTAAEAAALADGNPLSYLRVSRAEIELPPDTSPYADVVYATAARNFARLRAAAPLLEEPGFRPRVEEIGGEARGTCVRHEAHARREARVAHRAQHLRRERAKLRLRVHRFDGGEILHKGVDGQGRST